MSVNYEEPKSPSPVIDKLVKHEYKDGVEKGTENPTSLLKKKYNQENINPSSVAKK
jgi:hypothetical protein